VAQREKRFRARRFKVVLNSVLKQGGGARLCEVEDTSGTIHTEAQKVKGAATSYFEGIFSGSHTDSWFEANGVGEGVKIFFSDSPAGRSAREDGLRGVFHTDWDALPPRHQRLKRMVLFKTSKVEDSIEEREAWFGDILRPISQEEWGTEWARKSRHTSGGPSGIRPDHIKAGGQGIHRHLREYYSYLLGIGVVPDQWKKAMLVAIEKIPGVTRLDKLRPLKLLEITMKGVVSIVKSRIRTKLEEAWLLNRWQMAFRAERRTALCTMNLVTLFEDAVRYKKDIHLVLIDIRKAFDSVIRTIGKEAAMRRLGLPMKVVEFFMELDRGNSNEVRTIWDSLLDGEQLCFEALRGIAQGSSDAPLMWIIFYDMVLCELDASGVGSATSADIGWAAQVEGGVSVFADDTALTARTTQDMQRAVDTLDEILGAVMLSIAPEKSQHLALINPEPRTGGDSMGRLTEEDLIAQDIPHRVQLGGAMIPWTEADVGARHLGYWVDLLGDWGDQVANIVEQIDTFTRCVQPARISRGLLLYAINAVLVPRILYPLTVAAVDAEEINSLERSVLKWVRRKLGVGPTYARDLIYSSKEVGGLGWIRWTTRVLKARSRLALDLSTHPEIHTRMIWEGMRLRHFEALGSGRTFLGGERDPWTVKVEENGTKNTICKTWLGSFDHLLSSEGVRWCDHWSPIPRRTRDHHLFDIASLHDSPTSPTIRRGADDCDIMWLSDLVDPSGRYIYNWAKLGSIWSWVNKLALRLGASKCTETGHWLLTGNLKQGHWMNEEVHEDATAHQTVWGEGLRVGALVWDPAQQCLGVVDELGTLGMGPQIRVTWVEGSWCCEWSAQQCSMTCRNRRGHGGRSWIPKTQPSASPTSELEEGAWIMTSRVLRLFGSDRLLKRRTEYAVWLSPQTTLLDAPSPGAGGVTPLIGGGVHPPQYCRWLGRHPTIEAPPPPPRVDFPENQDMTQQRDWGTCRREEMLRVHKLSASKRPPPSGEELYTNADPPSYDSPPDYQQQHGGDWNTLEPDSVIQEALLDNWGVEGEASDRLGGVVLVTDGGFKRSITASTTICSPPTIQRLANAQFMVRDRSACGWVMGVDAALHPNDGSEQGKPLKLMEGGGAEPHKPGARGSSYRSELWGIVCALRAVSTFKARYGCAGPISHWTDNESICKIMQRRGSCTTAEWRGRKSRDLWAEIRGRLNAWYHQGGSWETSWVRSHVDSDRARSQSSYTLAEHMNISADQTATHFLEQEEEVALTPTLNVAPMAEAIVMGVDGIWTTVPLNTPDAGNRVEHWDNIDEMLVETARSRALASYWVRRMDNRVKQATISPAFQEARPVPDLDPRLYSTTATATVSKGLDIFKSKLWWDHLPSQQVLARGDGSGSSSLLTCDLCGQPEAEGSTWHLLACCRGNDVLTQARLTARNSITAAIDNASANLDAEYAPLRARLRHFYRMENDMWNVPVGWEGRTGTKAGLQANPWYGIFGTNWLDGWLETLPAPSSTHFDKGRRLLSQVSSAAIKACSILWSCFSAIRRDNELADEVRDRDRNKKHAEAKLKERLTRGSHSRRLRGARMILDPIKRASLLNTCHRLKTRAHHSLLLKRASELTRQDSHLLEFWHLWSLRKVQVWGTRDRRLERASIRARRRSVSASRSSSGDKVQRHRITDYFKRATTTLYRGGNRASREEGSGPNSRSSRSQMGSIDRSLSSSYDSLARSDNSTSTTIKRGRVREVGSCDQFG
jgi:hypothetical protein